MKSSRFFSVGIFAFYQKHRCRIAKGPSIAEGQGEEQSSSSVRPNTASRAVAMPWSHKQKLLAQYLHFAFIMPINSAYRLAVTLQQLSHHAGTGGHIASKPREYLRFDI